MNQSQEIDKLAAALVKAQSEIKPAALDGEGKIQTRTGRDYSYDYSTLNSVWDACREALHNNGLSVVQLTDDSAGAEVVTVVTRLIHTSGQWMEGRLSMKPTQPTPQAIGSCLTYCRRYSLAALVGIVSGEDDDAQEASKPPAYTGYGQQRPENPAKGTFPKDTVTTAAGNVRNDVVSNASKIRALPSKFGVTMDEVLAHAEIEDINKLNALIQAGDAEALSRGYFKALDYFEKQKGA